MEFEKMRTSGNKPLEQSYEASFEEQEKYHL